MTAYAGLRLTYNVPFEMVTEQRSCDKKPEQALLSLWLGVWAARGGGDVGDKKATEKGLQTGEDKTTYGRGPPARTLSPCGVLRDPRLFSRLLPT